MGVKLKIKTLMLIALIFSSVELYSMSCNMDSYAKGYNGRVVFECDDDISLKDNKLVFYVTGKNVHIEGISFDGVETDYSIEEISRQIKKVSLNVFIKGWLDDQDFVAEKDKQTSFKLKVARGSNPNYEILWGGIVKNSYKNYRSKANNIQLYKDKTGNIYMLKKGLDCSIKDDCDSKIYIDDDCSKNGSCEKLKRHFDSKIGLGIIHQRLI